jgi:hypothetical protein
LIQQTETETQTMQNHSFPPPAPPPPPPGFQAPAAAPQYAPAPQQLAPFNGQPVQNLPPAPQAAPPAYGYAQPAPAAAPPPPAYAPAPAQAQGYAAPAPQGFSQAPGNIAAPSLNSVAVNDLNLLPQVNINATTRFQIVSYVSSVRQSGPAYTIGLKCVSSNEQSYVAGTTFHQLCKISHDPRKQGGDKSRKKFVAAAFGQNPNAAINWDACDEQLKQRDFAAQPLFMDLDQRVNYSRPVLDQNTKQPVPQQWWSDSNWRLVTV